MIFFDFEIQNYFKSNKYLIAIVNYSRKKSKISKKQMQKDNLISHATFRRAEVTDFVGHSELLNKLAFYFNIPIDYDMNLINEINDYFNQFYTYLYFNQLDKMKEYYQKIESKKSMMENSILLSIYHFARVIYYISSPKRVEIDAISESLEQLELFREDLTDIFQFLLDQYTYYFYSLNHQSENAIKYYDKVYTESKKFPRHIPLVLYQMALNHYFVNDYANSIFYSIEALEKLEADLNYSRALLCNLNIAICFERLDNTVKSKEIINKIYLHMVVNDNPRTRYLADLTLANCYVTEKNYELAIEKFTNLESTRQVKGENSLMIIYCYYKLGKEEELKKLASFLHKERENKNFFYGYDDLVILFEELLSRNKKSIFNKFLIAQKSFPAYSDSKIVDLVFKELKARKIIQKS